MNVVKDDDGEAQLVYVYNFDPDYHYRTITINVNGVEYDRVTAFCQNDELGLNGAITEFEDDMEAAGFVTDKNEYSYSVEDTTVGGPVDLDVSNVVEIPTGHTDLVVNVDVKNDDIATDPDTGLILDVTAEDDATPAGWIDRAGSTIRYGFYVTVDSDVDVETVTWTEETVLTNDHTNTETQSASIDDAAFRLVDETDTTKTYLVQKNAKAENVSNVEIIRVTGAKVGVAPAEVEEPEINVDTIIEGTFTPNTVDIKGGSLSFTDVTGDVEIGDWDAWTLANAVVSYRVYNGTELVDTYREAIGTVSGADLAGKMPVVGNFESNGNYTVEILVLFNGTGADDSDTVYGLTGNVNFRVNNI